MSTTKDKRRIICIHGYGVRGFFWTALRTHLEDYFINVQTPDLAMQDIESAIEEVVRIAKTNAAESGNPVVLIGHSLGGILCSMAAMRLEANEIDSLVIIASPFGERGGKAGGFIRFLIRHRLLPGRLVRSRFFGSSTPKYLQKELFDKAVPESVRVQEAIGQPRWFHSNALAVAGSYNVLGIASEGDRIVNSEETQNFTLTLGGRYVLFPAELDIGHDDFTVHEPAIRQVLAVLLPFLGHPYELPSKTKQGTSEPQILDISEGDESIVPES